MGKVRHHTKKTVAKVRTGYKQVMPEKRHHRVLIWVAFFSISITIALQLMYPLDRALPFARINSQFVGLQNSDELASNLNTKFTQSRHLIVVDKQNYLETDISKTGGSLGTDKIVMTLEDYPFWMRFVPFSILFMWPNTNQVPVDYQPVLLREFAENASRNLSKQATNASLSIKDGQIIAASEQSGRVVSSQEIEDAIMSVNVNLGHINSVSVNGISLPADTSTGDLAQVKGAAESAISKSIRINVGEKSFSPDKDQVASWLSIIKSSNDEVEVAVNGSKLTDYLNSINDEVGTKAGNTAVTLVNGIETNRTEGQPGKRLATEQAGSDISNMLLDTSIETIDYQAKLIDIPPIVMYNNRYTASSEGLQAYVRDAAVSEHSNIVVRQLDGPGWSAEADGNLSTVSASTYKLYVSLYLFDQMNKGKTGWGDPMLDTTVSGCFDRMTIASTNPCAQSWLSSWGRTNVNNFVYSHGFSTGTSFTNSLATHTTANDLAKFMTGLEDGSLINGAHRDRLLRSLSVHPYRTGVPAGSAGQVWDKVGFLWDYVHDAAIVHHPRGRYVIVVMTKGESYATIAKITREVEKILYP